MYLIRQTTFEMLTRWIRKSLSVCVCSLVESSYQDGNFLEVKQAD